VGILTKILRVSTWVFSPRLRGPSPFLLLAQPHHTGIDPYVVALLQEAVKDEFPIKATAPLKFPRFP
jgi:hypothetical protein